MPTVSHTTLANIAPIGRRPWHMWNKGPELLRMFLVSCVSCMSLADVGVPLEMVQPLKEYHTNLKNALCQC